MFGKTNGTALVAAILITGTLTVGIAAAAIALPATETVGVDENVTELEVVVENITNDDTGNHTDANLVLYGVADDGTQSAVENADLNTTTDRNVAVWVYGDGENETLNATKYPEYKVELSDGSSVNTSVQSLNVYQYKSTGGGGAILPSGFGVDDLPTAPAVGGLAVLALIGAAWREM